MIRVNLLPDAADRRKAQSSGGGLDAAQRIAIGGGLILVLAAGFVGWRYWALGQEAAQVERDIEAQKREEQRLVQVISEVRDFEARRERLQQRVSLIEELRRGQTAPVHILDQISRALPDMMWLTSMKQSGYDITMEGNCLSLTSLSDFVGNLEGSHYFARPVEIITSEVVTATSNSPELIKFTVKATFQMAGLQGAPAAAAPAKKGGARG